MAVGRRRGPSLTASVDDPPGELAPAASETPPASIELLRGLRLLGLASREARLYLALAQAGPAHARDLARGARLHRATTYRALLRLVRRGLVAGNGSRPQQFVSLAPEAVFRRLGSFLREEEEVVQDIADVYGRWSNGSNGSNTATGHRPLSWLVTSTSDSASHHFGHPALAMLAAARHSVAVMAHLPSIGPRYRFQLAAELSRLARGLVRTRVITDVTMADRRFLRTFAREGPNYGGALEVRYFTPVAAHFYVIDDRILVRFPVQIELGHTSDTGVATEEPMRIRTQLARFEGTWTESTAATARAVPPPFGPQNLPWSRTNLS